MVVYGHDLRYVHHTGLLSALNYHQSDQSLRYFTEPCDNDYDWNIISDHL